MEPLDLQEESILHRLGYNVSQKDNLLVETRRKILQYAVESGLLTKPQIVNHLSFLIKMNEGHANFEIALKRWNDDRNWLRGYESTGERLVGISYIVDET